MIDNWSASKDDLYGPPPAYSIRNSYVEPPPSYTPSVYVVPHRAIEYRERSSSHACIVIPLRLSRYFLMSGLVHMVIGLGSIVCDIILTIMNESYSFTGLWTGALSIILGIDLILCMSRPQTRTCSLQRLQFVHMAMCLVSIIALILSSMNLASDSCFKIFLGPDRCQNSSYIIKIILVTFFSFTFVQLCITATIIFVYISKSRRSVTRNDSSVS